MFDFFVSPNYRPQLDRIEKTLNRMEHKMSEQETALNDALNSFFQAVNDGLTRIEAKLAEAAPQVDLSDEVAAIKAAQDAFQARVEADAPPEA